ncbi:MAG: PD-(D/E)XK nuclease family protein, partial [Parvularculaceae bacterium]|nr:PD-(D/E)XK nuclease family protein [Parvularculaceae bacterium]
PVRLLTNAVADRIARWVRDGVDGALFSPGDALILVQTRSALFHEMIKALSRCGVPVAGADRIELLADPAVEDLLAFARAALFEGDDLALAETLKGPFFNFDDDALFELAHGRAGRLVDALRASPQERAKGAASRIEEARRIGLAGGAFRFFAHILETGAPSGRQKLEARLGPASRDAVEELLRQALAHESLGPRSLRGFVDAFLSTAGDVKREMSERGPAARVMTVHGAKGLQAPAVFLLDAHKLPKNESAGVFALPADASRPSPSLFALSRRKNEDPRVLLAARETAATLEYEEYRRRFYVAATRAEDRLIICGVTPGKGDHAALDADRTSWYELSSRAMRRLGAQSTPFDAFDGDVLFVENAGTSATRDPPKGSVAADPSAAFPDRPVRAEIVERRIQPSRLASESGDDGAAASPASGRTRGRLIHMLLERLPDIEPQRRRDAGLALARRAASDVPEAERRLWIDEALAVLDHPDFAPVFRPEARAEAAIVGRIAGPRGAVVVVNGAIDRLLVEEKRVLIVDYKTNRPPPERVADAPRSYVAQLAAYRALLQQIYPASEISCALLWTYAPRLMAIPDAMLDHALMSALEDALDP